MGADFGGVLALTAALLWLLLVLADIPTYRATPGGGCRCFTREGSTC
jgi:hypothetical protein